MHSVRRSSICYWRSCVGVVPSSQSAAQPLATTLSVRCTIDEPAELLTLSTQPIGGRFALEMENVTANGGALRLERNPFLAELRA